MNLSRLLFEVLQGNKNSSLVINKLKEAGHESMWAGGSVRDSILKKLPKDFDVVTSATPDQVIDVFKKQYKVLEVGKQFGVVVVIVDGEQIEVATYRKDIGTKDGRRPESVDMKGISAEEDAKRRDFTINGLFKDSEGNIIDHVGGQEDIKNKIIRFIGNPEARIADDKLRMLRAVRFALKLDFTIEPNTLKAIQRNADKIKSVSWERISQEFFKMLDTGKVRKTIELLDKTKLLNEILPEIKALDGVQQPKEYHPEGDVLQHTIGVAERIAKHKDSTLTFAGLLHDVGKPATYSESDRIRFHQHHKNGAEIARNIAKRFKLTNKNIELIGELVYRHMGLTDADKMKKSTLKAYMALPYFEDLMKLIKADGDTSARGSDHYDYIMSKREEFGKEAIKPKPFIDGKDLINMGLKQGKEIGRIKTLLYKKQLEDEITSKEQALEVAKDEIKQVA